jgi:hypothetical protein
MRDVDNVGLVEHRDRGTATDFVDDLLKERLQDDLSIDGAEISGSNRKDFRPEEEAPAGSADVAEFLKRMK